MWEKFNKGMEWQILKKELHTKKAQIPSIKDADTKEAFFYAAIRNQVIDELLELPERMAENIKRLM